MKNTISQWKLVGESQQQFAKGCTKMRIKTKDNIMVLIFKKVKNGIDSLFDFSMTDNEFKKAYGYTKEQILNVVNTRF